MATTVKLVLHKNYKKKNGTYPIVLRITKDRKSKYVFIGEYVLLKDWNAKESKVKSSHTNSARLNNLLLKKLSEAYDTALESQTKSKDSSVANIRKEIVGDSNLGFFKVASFHLNAVKKRKKIGQFRTEEGRLAIFKQFLGVQELFFYEIDVPLLKRFRSYMLHEREVSPRTTINYLILIRTIYNLAIKEHGVDGKNYPFGKDKIQIRLPETEKIGLTKEEVGLLENTQNLTEAQQHAVYAWLLSFYFAGIRVGDLLQLRWSDFRDGRLFYRMGKNEKIVSLAIPLKAQAILNTYKNRVGNSHFVLPYLSEADIKSPTKWATRKNTITRSLNKRLATTARNVGIDKPLSMHIARHSFGNISGDKIPIQMLQKLYRHSSITTTVNYQANFMHRETDEALDKVINF